MRKSTVIFISIAGVVLLEALGIYCCLFLGLSPDDLVKLIPIISTQTVTTCVALIFGVLSIVDEGIRLRITASNVQWDIYLSIHIQNRSNDGALSITTVDVPGFYSQWPKGEGNTKIGHNSGIDMQCLLKPLGDPAENDAVAEDILERKNLEATVSLRYEGSERVVQKRVKFHNPMVSKFLLFRFAERYSRRRKFQ